MSCLTCTRDSGRLILSAASSLMNMSGYLVLVNNDSRQSNWALVKVVRSLLCFLICPGGYPSDCRWSIVIRFKLYGFAFRYGGIVMLLLFVEAPQPESAESPKSMSLEQLKHFLVSKKEFDDFKKI